MNSLNYCWDWSALEMMINYRLKCKDVLEKFCEGSHLLEFDWRYTSLGFLLKIARYVAID